MLLEMHMVVRCLLCLCLVGFAAAAKCQPETCGSMNVSYPFWIDKSDCGQPGFQIICNKSNSGEQALLLPAFKEYNASHIVPMNFTIMEINYTGYLIINSTDLKAYSCNVSTYTRKMFEVPVEGPFTISSSNRFVVIGCAGWGTYSYGEYGEVRCIPDCQNLGGPAYCDYGCCETVLADNWKLLNFTGGGRFNHRNSTTHKMDDLCVFSTVFDPSTFTVVDNKTDLFWGEGRKANYGLRLNWGVGLQNCSLAKSTGNYSCDINAKCFDSPTGDGHVCKCRLGYDGSGYSKGTSCIDINECSSIHLNDCATPPKGICHNFAGSFNCSCGKGYKGDGRQCEPTDSNNSVISAIIGSVSSFIGVSLGACALFWWLRRRRLKDLRDKNFRQNGGLQLQDLIGSMGGRKGLTIFSEKELDAASNNYSTELGKGGFATVYKGVLLDHTAVAIKKPKAISGNEFINEIVILSHINHRNIVKLFGCCLETQFPLLVYEFVPNGTLSEHLHTAEKHLPWETRRQIAIEAADAIAYMHHHTSQPILHRDIKSANILLDDTFTPKVADFGISRLRPSDETHLSTNIAMGTRGYVDPEFIRSNQFTVKSDVFSFGVVLVELLTGLKPLFDVEGSVCILYEFFRSKTNQNDLSEILDPNVVSEENQWQMENMARLARACLQVKTEARPSMREVVDELAWIRAATKQPGLYRDVSLVEHRGDSKQTKLNDYSLLGAGESSSQDLYPWPASNEIITYEDPSSRLMSDIRHEMRL